MVDAAALQILMCVRAVRRLNGSMAEAGVLMGGSARLICHEKGDVPLHLFDVFETLQAPISLGDADEAEIRAHFGAVHGRRDAVERLLAPYDGVALHSGVFPKTTAGMEGERFSFVHLDLDLPGSTRDALAFFHPRLLKGGILIGDDYDDLTVRATFRAYFGSRDDTVIDLPWGQVMVVKHDDPAPGAA
ncbi:MAG: TylF/MycF/NovP-related O-methyltransferase [Sphingomonadales bacterium]